MQTKRLEHLDRGPVWVAWNFDHDPIFGSVVFVHGHRLQSKRAHFYVDQMVEEHRIFDRFAASGSKSLLIVPRARHRSRMEDPWPNLAQLLKFVDKHFATGAQEGPLHVIGHSGAYTQIKLWLEEPMLNHVTLLDALYGFVRNYKRYAKRSHVRLDLCVSRNQGKPHRNSRALAKELDASWYDALPGSSLPTDAMLDEKVIYLGLRIAHMSWVNGRSNVLEQFMGWRTNAIERLRGE